MQSTHRVGRLTLLLSTALVACGTGSDGSTGSTESPCLTDSALTYSNFGQAFIEEHCLACHSSKGPGSPRLDTLAQVQSSRDAINDAAAAGPDGVNTYMPQGRSVPVEERRKLGEWLACGAPE